MRRQFQTQNPLQTERFLCRMVLFHHRQIRTSLHEICYRRCFEAGVCNDVNKLVFGHQTVLRPLLQSLREMNDKAQLLKMQELEEQIEKNIEQRQVLTSLMAADALSLLVFNKESNALAAEAEALRQEKDSLMHSLNGNMVKADELQKLLRFASKGTMLTGFEDGTFLEYVDRVTVCSRSEVSFELKCGLCLRERLVD